MHSNFDKTELFQIVVRMKHLKEYLVSFIGLKLGKHQFDYQINKDYKLSLLQSAKQSNQTKGGHNKEIFMLNIETFKNVV